MRVNRRQSLRTVTQQVEVCEEVESPIIESDNDNSEVQLPFDAGSEVVVGHNDCTEEQDRESKYTQTACSALSSQCSSTQTSSVVESITPFLSLEELKKDKQLLHYYTGLECTQKLLTVFATLGPAVNHLNYHRTNTVEFEIISPLNQFILMLAKLRQDLDYFPLSKLCGVSTFTAQNIFITWINFCSRQWAEISIWPEKDLTNYYSPEDFKVKFPTTRVIVDGTEIPIQKPSNPMSQRATFIHSCHLFYELFIATNPNDLYIDECVNHKVNSICTCAQKLTLNLVRVFTILM